jgi:hypothetical protein
MAQAVNRSLFTVEARVRARVIPYGICGVQNGTGTDFSPSSSVCRLSSFVSITYLSPGGQWLQFRDIDSPQRHEPRGTVLLLFFPLLSQFFCLVLPFQKTMANPHHVGYKFSHYVWCSYIGRFLCIESIKCCSGTAFRYCFCSLQLQFLWPQCLPGWQSISYSTFAKFQYLYLLFYFLFTFSYKMVLLCLLMSPWWRSDYNAYYWTQTLRVRTRPRRWILKDDKNPQHTFLRMGSKAGGPLS